MKRPTCSLDGKWQWGHQPAVASPKWPFSVYWGRRGRLGTARHRLVQHSVQRVSLSLPVLPQWRWKLVICAGGGHPFENNMPRINQGKKRSALPTPHTHIALLPPPSCRWTPASLCPTSLPKPGDLHRKCNYAEPLQKTAATTTMSGLLVVIFSTSFFFSSCNHFLKWLGKWAVNERGVNASSSPESCLDGLPAPPVVT